MYKISNEKLREAREEAWSAACWVNRHAARAAAWASWNAAEAALSARIASAAAASASPEEEKQYQVNYLIKLMTKGVER